MALFGALDAHGPSLMKIVILVLLFVYIVAFFWILWKSAANLRWYHMVAISLTMFMTIPLLPLTAAVLKSRTAWAQLAQDLEERLRRSEQEQVDLISGVEGDPQRDPGVRELQTELRGLNAEVGRVFRDMDASAGPNGFVLTKSPDTPQVTPDGLPVDPAAEPAADPNAPPAGPIMGVGSIVYGFAENTIRESGYMLPVFYLGEFRVTQAAGDSMTLVPTRPLDPPQLQAANNAPRWALYELMPVDSHEAFVALRWN